MNNIVLMLPSNFQRGFQIPSTPIAEGIFAFHDDLICFLSGILVFVVYVLYICISRGHTHFITKGTSHRLVHASTLEIIWTIVPALILVIIAVPSFSLLYSVDEIIEPMFTIKVVGHQWYWSYEFLDPQVVVSLYNDSFANTDVDLFKSDTLGGFDSYLLSEDELMSGGGLTNNRLLTVDNHLFLPTKMHVRAMVTSADVLHSWAIPSLGVKLDACPGRLNQTSLFIKRKSIYYGQCSEICGMNHGFMPIGIASQDFFIGLNSSILDYEALMASFITKSRLI
jgi:cytochrome c oxidase subunit 2